MSATFFPSLPRSNTQASISTGPFPPTPPRFGFSAFSNNGTVFGGMGNNHTVSSGRPKSKFTLIHKDAVWPTRGTPGAAGFDLYPVESFTIPASNDTTPGVSNYMRVGTGVSVIIPEGSYGRIAPRSGWSHNHQIDVLAGVIDSDFRGQIMVSLINHSKAPVNFPKDKAIAQLIITIIDDRDYEKLTPEQYLRLTPTTRGANGFGSTDLVLPYDVFKSWIPDKEGFCNGPNGCHKPVNFCKCGLSGVPPTDKTSIPGPTDCGRRDCVCDESQLRTEAVIAEWREASKLRKLEEGRSGMQSPIPRPVSRRGHIAIDVAETCLKDD